MQILTEKSLCFSCIGMDVYIVHASLYACNAHRHPPISVTFNWCRPAVLLLRGARAPHASDNDYYCG